MQVEGGTTDVTTYFALRLTADGTAATGLTITNFDLQYVRSGAAPSAKVDATALAATDSAHADNKAIEIDATDQPGVYRVDWPDAAFAAGVPEVVLTVKVATAFTEHLAVQIDAPVDVAKVDGDATAAANLNLACDNYSATRGLTGTALPAAAADAAGGVPVSDAGGLALDTMVGTDGKVAISTDAQDLSGTLDVNTKTVTNAAITAAAIATDAIDADALKTDAAEEIADQVWDEAQSGHVAAGSAGLGLNALSALFTNSSPMRLIDHLRAMMSKGATAPSSGVGTYDPTTDALEISGECLSTIKGAGFSTSTDSLKGIRDAIDILFAPAVVGTSSLSGSGFLSDVVSLVRKATDEPNQSPKYTDGDIVEYLQAGMDAVMPDIAVNTDHPIVVRYEITLVDGTQYYVLPPNVAELIRVAKINSSTGLPEYEVWPGSHMNQGGSGWKLEGNVLRLLRDWDSTDTLELMYYPNSEPAMHKGTSEATAAASVTLMAVPTDGTLGTRPNEYVGMLLRILSSDQKVQEERLITAYNVTTRVATLAKDFDTTPTGTVVYEVVPIFSRTIKHVVALRTAIDILSQEGNSQRMATLNQNYAVKLSAMRRQLSKMEGRFPHHFEGDNWDNTNRGGIY